MQEKPLMTKTKIEALVECAEAELFSMRFVAIHPDFQRRGLGVAMVKESLKRVRAFIPST